MSESRVLGMAGVVVFDSSCELGCVLTVAVASGLAFGWFDGAQFKVHEVGDDLAGLVRVWLVFLFICGRGIVSRF